MALDSRELNLRRGFSLNSNLNMPETRNGMFALNADKRRESRQQSLHFAKQ